MNKKPITTLLILSIFVIVIGVFFLSRQIFFYKYEPEYYENWYYHSQWNIPQSTRGISDGELYKFVGYQLAQGENPFNINYQIPPFAKYLYGLAEKYINNPYWISISFYLLSLFVLYQLAQKLFKNKNISLLTILLFVTTPFVATQIKETMLDLPHMFLYLTHTYFMVKYLQKYHTSDIVFSGIFLGLATGTKPGIYTPLIFLLGLIFILLKNKKSVQNIIFYTNALGLGYVLSFFSYFIKHPNPIPWIKLHKKTLEFYLKSNNNIDYLNQWKGIFFNTYQGWWQTGKMSLGDWSPILPLGVISAFIVLIYTIKTKKIETIYISLLVFSFLGINTFIPFWPRYLMPIIPLFILLIIYLTKKFKIIIVAIVILNLPFLYQSLKIGTPSGDAQASARFISTRAYRELYRSISPQQRKTLTETDFINIMENLFNSIGTRFITTTVSKTPISQTNQETKILFKITYKTKYGDIVHQPTITFRKINNQWKTLWNWEYLLPKFNPKDKIIITEKNIPFSTLKDYKGNILAKRGNGKTVYIIPRLMFDWNKSLNAISKTVNKSPIDVNIIIRSVIPDKYPRYVGYLDYRYNKQDILAIPGASVQNIEYATINNGMPAKYVSQKIKDLQQKQPQLFYIPAEIYLQKTNGEKITILNTLKNQQQNIIITLPKPKNSTGK